MRFLPAWLARIIGDGNFDKTVGRIVQMVEPNALQAIAVHSPGMSSFEARGYIRARSALLISNQVSAEIRAGVAPQHRTRLIEAAREQLTQVLLPQIPQLRPAEVQPLRRVA